MYYVHTDHLGSLNVITNSAGAIVQESSYDAWGNRRDPATLQNYTTTPTGLITDRGFTGHEHMDAFKLINMNGRIYDPALGRFLSPDKYVQAPDFTQSYNRYSYCMNNPLSFTDPSGYLMNPASLWVFRQFRLFSNDYYMQEYGTNSLDYNTVEESLGHGGAGSDSHIAGMGGYSYGNGVYRDNATGQIVDFNTVMNWERNNGGVEGTKTVKRVINNTYEGAEGSIFRGFIFTDGSSWYTEDGIESLILTTIQQNPNNTKAGILLFGKEGCGHAFVYDPNSATAYEVGFPNRCDKNYLKALKKGLPSIGYKYINALTSKDFWGTCPDATRTKVDFALVFVPDKAAAVAFYESYVGKNWDWEPWGTCKNFVLEGFEKGGTDPKFNRANIGILPCDFSEPFTIHYNNPFLKK